MESYHRNIPMKLVFFVLLSNFPVENARTICPNQGQCIETMESEDLNSLHRNSNEQNIISDFDSNKFHVSKNFNNAPYPQEMITFHKLLGSSIKPFSEFKEIKFRKKHRGIPSKNAKKRNSSSVTEKKFNANSFERNTEDEENGFLMLKETLPKLSIYSDVSNYETQVTEHMEESTTTKSSLDEFCAHACPVGNGGSICHCADHPIGKRSIFLFDDFVEDVDSSSRSKSKTTMRRKRFAQNLKLKLKQKRVRKV